MFDEEILQVTFCRTNLPVNVAS